MVEKSFPQKQVPTKNFHQFFGRKFVMVAVIPSKTGSYQKLSSKSFLVEKFYCCKIISSEMGSYQKISVENYLWMQCHFLENRYIPKLSSKFFVQIFLSKLFYDCKVISSKTGSYQKFSSTFFWSNFFIVAK
jgi:hypothetical protein